MGRRMVKPWGQAIENWVALQNMLCLPNPISTSTFRSGDGTRGLCRPGRQFCVGWCSLGHQAYSFWLGFYGESELATTSDQQQIMIVAS